MKHKSIYEDMASGVLMLVDLYLEVLEQIRLHPHTLAQRLTQRGVQPLSTNFRHDIAYLQASKARAGVRRWITFFNQLLPHAAHGGQPPAVVQFNANQTDQQVQEIA